MHLRALYIEPVSPRTDQRCKTADSLKYPQIAALKNGDLFAPNGY